MAVLPIVVAPDPRLKLVCAPVERVDEAVRRLMDDLLETMYRAPGVGLAAPQVGVPKRVLVVDASRRDEPPAPLRMADPELLWRSETLEAREEGCLSLPGHYAEVSRPGRARIGYLDETGARRELEAEGLLATCIQHEMDHLDGVLFVDRISSLKRGIILRKLTKARKADAKARG